MKNMVKRAMKFSVSRQALHVFLFGAITILSQLGYIVFDVFFGTHTNRLYMMILYQKCIEYILLEVVIVVAGAFLFDVTVREAEGV